MKYKQLGNTNVSIDVIGQGTWGVGGYFTKDETKDNFYIEMIQRGIAHGLTFIDTAESYGAGHSEELVGRSIRNCRKNVFIATKVSPEHLSYNDVIKSAEESLRRLQIDSIDLYQIHWPNSTIPLEETFRAMERLVESGKVKYIGVSNFSLRQLKLANEVFYRNKIVSLQVEYNLFDRTIEDAVLPYCDQRDITVIAYSPLDRGKSFTDDGKTATLEKVAIKYNKTPAQIALRWLIFQKPVVVIPKATSDSHLTDNASVADFNLNLEDIALIDRIFKPSTVHIPPEQIRVDKIGLEAFIPGPEDLARDIQMGDTIKPIRVVKTQDISGKYLYDLVEGKLRYWAWVIATDGKVPIPALVR